MPRCPDRGVMVIDYDRGAQQPVVEAALREHAVWQDTVGWSYRGMPVALTRH